LKIKKIIIPAILSLIHTLITFFKDNTYFEYSLSNNEHLQKVIMFKIIIFIILTIFYYFVIKIIKQKLYKKDYFKIFIISFSIMIILLILTWPGVFRNDELGIILYAKTLRYEPWHHTIISIIMIIELMLIPFPTGTIIINCLLYSVIISYVVSNLAKYFKDIKYRYIILMIPFLLLPVLENNLYPLRPIMYGYLELFWFSYLYFNYKNKSKINFGKAVLIIITSILLITLRSEAICYIPLVLIMYIAYYKQNIISLKKLITLIIIFLFGFVMIDSYDEQQMNSEYGHSYKLSATHGFIKQASQIAVEQNNENYIINLNKGFCVECISRNPNDWVGRYLNRQISEKDTQILLKTYLKIVLENPGLFLKERIHTFANSNAFVKNRNTNIFDSQNLFDDDKDTNTLYAYNLLINTKGLYIKPINKTLRKNVIYFLEGKNSNNKTNILFHIFWNSTIPILTVLIFAIYNLIKKKILELLLCLFILGKTFLIFLTAPESYFMYYFSVYIIGYVILMVGILHLIKIKKEKSD